MISLWGTKSVRPVVERVDAWRVPATGAAMVAGVMMLIATVAQAKLKACPAPTGTPPTATISQCCRVTKPGDYTMSGNLNVSGGACIKVVASGVMLDGNGKFLYNSSGTGVGIRLLPTATGDVVYDFPDIENFRTGILDDAAHSVLAGVQVDSSTGNGIVIRANRVSLFATSLLPSSSAENGGYGVVVEPRYPASVVSNVDLGGVDVGDSRGGLWLDSLRTSTITDCSILNNGGDGIDLIGSIGTTITHTGAKDNAGDGIKIAGGHGNVLTGDSFGIQNEPNKIGLVLRNSAFDTITGDEIRYNTGDGMLMVRGDHETIVDTDSFNNGGSGIHLKRTTASSVSGVNVGSNNGAGIWLDGSSGITVEDASSSNNSRSQVYIGCSPKYVPDGTTCASRGLPASNGNRVAQGSFDTTSGVAPEYGIGIDRGNHNNQVLDNQVGGDSLKDLIDENKNCDSNLWMFNSFSTASPSSCID